MAKKLEKLPYSSIKSDKRTTFLYTKGGEYSLDGKEYIGEYHITGEVVKTGPVPDRGSKILRKYYSNNLLYDYDRSRQFVTRDFVEPDQIVISPKPSDYEAGSFTRYFVERAGAYEGYPIEINRAQYTLYGKDKGVDAASYNLVLLNWKLIGSERNVYRNGVLYVKGIFEHNQEEVYKNTPIIPNLPGAIKSYTEFARITLKYYTK